MKSQKENKIAINYSRLAWCCREAQITLAQLSKEKDIVEKTLQKAQRGEAALSIRQLEKIAKYFDRGLLFFLEPQDVDPERVYSPQFRTIRNQKAIQSQKMKSFIQRVEQQREVYLSLLEDLENKAVSNWYPKSLISNKNDMKSIAKDVRKWLGLKNKNSFESLRRSVEQKDIMVIVDNGYAGSWQLPKEDETIGFSLYYEQLPVIVIKKESIKERQAFTLMHELDTFSYIEKAPLTMKEFLSLIKIKKNLLHDPLFPLSKSDLEKCQNQATKNA